jgi:hypothetical protein
MKYFNERVNFTNVELFAIIILHFLGNLWGSPQQGSFSLRFADYIVACAR